MSGQDQSSALAPNLTWPDLHQGLYYAKLSALYIFRGEAAGFSVRNHPLLLLTLDEHNAITF